MIGKPISHYKILEKLGGGGMGVFYLEEDNKFERRMLSNFASDLGHSKEQKRFEINNLKM